MGAVVSVAGFYHFSATIFVLINISAHMGMSFSLENASCGLTEIIILRRIGMLGTCEKKNGENDVKNDLLKRKPKQRRKVKSTIPIFSRKSFFLKSLRLFEI